MKKMIVIIIVLPIIFVGMIIYRNLTVKVKNNINIEEIEKIEQYISKIYMWKEVTKEALPEFEEINQVDEIWIWEVVKKNMEEYEIEYSKIQETAKQILGEKLDKQFPKEGNQSFAYNEETDKYLAIETTLDEKEDCFLLSNIEKTIEGFEIDIIEYLEDYSEQNNIIIKNLKEEEIGKITTQESEIKIQEIIKSNIERFDKKKLYLQNVENNIIIQKVVREQE